MEVSCAKIGYARVSTCDQNLDLQIRALTAAGCAEIFRDDGISAIAPERPAFAQVLGALQSGDTLVIWKMDRAFRSLMHALTVLEELERRGIAFQSLTEEIDTATAMGRFVYQIRNAFAELERAIISERTRAGMAAAIARGAAIGRPRKLTGEQIERARREIAEGGKTIAHLARSLNVAPITLSRALEREACADITE
jgi:DNA invertase Pin-like site-specific DNA recombinase